MRPIRAIVFDFDGTLCDSADVKTRAFHALYLDERGPEFADAVRAYHLAHAGVSRYDKIRHIEGEMLGTDANPERVDIVAKRFSDLVEQAVIAAPLFDGVAAFLDRAHGVVPMAVASATPRDELRRIVRAKGIDARFDVVDGSPRSKADIISGMVEVLGLDPQSVVMVGDQPSDVEGAARAGARALVITTDEEAYDVPTVGSFADAADWLLARMATPDRDRGTE